MERLRKNQLREKNQGDKNLYMEVGIRQFFIEPKATFEIYYLVRVKISEVINKELKKEYGFKDIKPGWTLSINLITGKKEKKLSIYGPDIFKKDKYINYTAVIPFSEIKNAKSLQEVYISNYFSVLKDLLKEYNIKDSFYEKNKQILIKEIIGNPVYEYQLS